MAFRIGSKKLGEEALFDYAVRALGRRALTEREVRLKLGPRAAREEDVERTIERLRGLEYLNDERTAESYAAARRDLESFGRRRVFSDLRRRGVDAETAERTVGEAFDGADELGLIREHLRRRMGLRIEQKIEDPREVQKLYRRLLRAGFSSARIGEALGKIAADPEWLEGFEDESAELDSAD